MLELADTSLPRFVLLLGGLHFPHVAAQVQSGFWLSSGSYAGDGAQYVCSALPPGSQMVDVATLYAVFVARSY